MRLSQPQIEKWSKTRQMGRSRYVWRFWVLGWGVTTAVFWSTFMAYKEGFSQLPVLLVLALIGFPLGGLFLGRLSWRLTERSYQKATGNGVDQGAGGQSDLAPQPTA